MHQTHFCKKGENKNSITTYKSIIETGFIKPVFIILISKKGF